MDAEDSEAESAQSTQHSSSSSIARRGVLAALGLGGLATLGTNSASAQAAGQVGTASNPIDVYGYGVEATNTFTDPAGVEHTGELADIDDVGGSIPDDVVTDGDGVDREIWVIANGASDPSGADAEDIIFEEEA